MTIRTVASIILALLLTGAGALQVKANAACYDLSKQQPQSLTGRLSTAIFPGPPNFEDVKKGDDPEPGFLLSLSNEICISGDEFANPGEMFGEVQLFASSEAVERELKQKNRQEVVVVLDDAFAAHTGHHHRPLVARVVSVSAAQMDQTGEYGSAATTVRAFYYALSKGNGDVASNYVVAEKRKNGPFSAASITSFYAKLEQPLELLKLKSVNANTFDVQYRFQSKTGICNGHSIVKTVTRDGQYFIERIRSLSGC